MRYPEFFDAVDTIRLRDPLAAFLGTLEDGVVEFSYLDIAKTAGHSCPTVAGAYLMTQITGATESLGFKGIGGNFVRHGLMAFGADIAASARLKRLDTGASVDVAYDPTRMPGDPRQQEIMQRMRQGDATPEDKLRFGPMWQERVAAIFERSDEFVLVENNRSK